MKKRSPEHDIQAAFFAWVHYLEPHYPRLRLIYAIPNGGHRDIRTAMRLKAEGVRAGVPDVLLSHPNLDNTKHGLYIEFKAGKNKLTKEQAYFFVTARSVGYECVECHEWGEAAAHVVRWLGMAAECLLVGGNSGEISVKTATL